MKKLIAILLVAALAVPATFAQKSAAQLAREKRELRKNLKKVNDIKPSKEAKNLAKQDVKDGWLVPSGARAFEYQREEYKYLEGEEMEDEAGNNTNRYILRNGRGVAKTYNAAYTAARSQAQKEIAAAIESEIATIESSSMDNDNQGDDLAVTSEQLHQRSKAIAQQCLKNTRQIMARYKQLDNKNYVVEVDLAFDRMELLKQIKADQRAQLKLEGDKLNDEVDALLKK